MLFVNSRCDRCRSRRGDQRRLWMARFNLSLILGRHGHKGFVCEIDFFIVWSTSRFARNKIDAALYKRSIRAGGTKIAYISQSISADSDEGWLMEGFLELMDEHVSRQIRKDTVAAMIKNASRSPPVSATIPVCDSGLNA